MGPTRCTPVALGFKGSEWGSKLARSAFFFFFFFGGGGFGHISPDNRKAWIV